MRPSTALLTDHYELTMLQSAIDSGAADRPSVFELFGRRLPPGRRYGVVAGVGRALDALEQFRFTDTELGLLRDEEIVDAETLSWLADYRFSGDIWGYPEGETYFAYSPLLTVEASFAEGVLLETLLLSVYNHDSAIASAASRMTWAAGERPCIEMGSRRTHEWAAVASARAAYVAGFVGSSNLQARLEYGVPSRGPAPTRSRCSTTPRRTRSAPRCTRWARARRCSSTPTTSPRRSHSGWRSPDPTSGPCGSTPATSPPWPCASGSSSTTSARRTPASSSPPTSTSSRSRGSRRPRSTATAWGPSS